MLLKFGRLEAILKVKIIRGTYQRASFFRNKKTSGSRSSEEKDGVVLLNDRITAIKNEENKILAKAE